MVVFVHDAAGMPVSGVTVRWRISSVPAGALGHALTDTVTVTSDSGRAATGLKLGDKVGTYTVEASSAGLAGSPVVFTAEAIPGSVRAPVAIVLTSGNSQSTTINTTLPSPFVVQIIDNANRPVSGVPVSFAIADSALPTGVTGQSISTTYALTDSAGRASTTLTLGNKVGVYTVLATSPGLTNSPITFTALATPGQPASLIAIAGDGQARRVGLTLQESFVLGVYDVGGNPVPGRQVQFAISSVPAGATGQSISTSMAVTNNLGRASTTLTLGNQPGEYIVTATVAGYSGSPVNFRATAQPLGASAIHLVSGNIQIGLIRATLPVPFTVRVVDQIGNPVDDVTVTFTIATAPSGSVGHRLSATTVQTDTNGQASTVLTLGTKVGVYIVHASSPGLSGSPVVFTATALPGAALLQTSGDGQVGRVLTKLRNPFVATVLDATGTPVPGVKVIWEVKSKPAGAIGYQLDSLSTVTNDSGRVVNFLTLGNTAGQYTVTATSAGLSGSPLTFTATAVSSSAPAVMLLTSGNNQAGYVSTSLAAPFVVTVLDSAARPVERVNVSFAIDTDNLPAGAVGQTLSANTVPTDSSGRAAVVLTLGNKPGIYRVFASVPGLANSPIVFQATATSVPPSALVLLSGSNQTARVRTTLPNPFTVVVFDARGNPVQGTQVTFAIDSLPTGSIGHSLSTTVATTNNLGLASTTLTFGQKSGRYVVRAESPGLANSPLRFVARALPEAPTVVAVASGNNQAKSIRETLDSALVVRVTDPNDNPVPGIIVNFEITEAPAGAVGQRLSTASGITDERGLASTRLTLGDKLGVYRVTATATGIGSVVFSARTEVVIADVNGDRGVNIADLTMVIDHILQRIRLTGIDSVKADVNSDGSIDVADVI
ncbi:MAG: dockerin type I domain-containing protein, partial [candidate division WOR-3 bacterium]